MKHNYSRGTSIAIAGGALAALIGCFMPWLTAGPFSLTGINHSGDAQLIAATAVLVGIFGVAAHARSIPKMWCLLPMFAAIAMTSISVSDFLHIISLNDEGEMFATSPGAGLLLTVLGSYTVAIGSVAMLVSPSEAMVGTPDEHTELRPAPVA